MHYLIENNGIQDPCVNLALEEYCLTRLDNRHAYFLLYVNQPSVIVGRNQNILQEIDSQFIKMHRLNVVRRMSGGGAVYHDSGNLNFSFIQNPATGGLQNLQPFLWPVVQTLQQMGVHATIDDRNDLMVEKRKISGSARFSNTRRMMVHGTVLFNANLQALVQALDAPAIRLQTRAIKSVRRPVANIRPLLNPPMHMDRLKKRLLTQISKQMGPLEKMSLNERHWKRIYRLAADKYRSWEWTFGRTPDFSVTKNGRSEHRLRIDVHRGKIAAIAALDSDCSNGLWHAVEKRLRGTRYERSAVSHALGGLSLPDGTPHPGAEQLASDICIH